MKTFVVFAISLSLALILPPRSNASANKSREISLARRNSDSSCYQQGQIELFSTILKKINVIYKKLVPTKIATNCAELYKRGHRSTGIYSIDPDGLGSFKVRCDMNTAGGGPGWTIFQRRLDGSVDFFRVWKDYKTGFGSLSGEFWLGLDKINRLTRQEDYELRVDMEDTTGKKAYAAYNAFSVLSEKLKYKLRLGTYSGNAGDSLSDQNGMSFSTKDSDNDLRSSNCAQVYKGSWWYKNCHRSNLNGIYHHGTHKSSADGVNWYHWKGYNYSLEKTEMKIRPSGFV